MTPGRLRADLKCWAFSPPGGLVSESLLPALGEWCVSVVCGKDAVPRMTVNNLARLMDEMVTALARTRCAAPLRIKLSILFCDQCYQRIAPCFSLAPTT